MKKAFLKISTVITVIGLNSLAYADSYRGVYKCYSSGVEWESATACPPAATSVQGGMNFSNHRMAEPEKANPYRNGGRTNAFAIKERYKKYRDDLRWNNVRTSDQEYLNRRLAEYDRLEKIELNNQ